MPIPIPDIFAAAWAESWNARDLDRVLAHFSDDVIFSTPKALEVVGLPSVVGRQALRDYWEAALSRIQHLRFAVVRTLWEPRTRELGIVYDREVNHSRDRALELLRFSEAGTVVAGEVFYGVTPR